ncbi:MAG: hypothetical protein EPO02_12940 [Nitrospirae bacterium]|nr:MAG: hypothetical protein EPO02_12940 [Nitrospirota bacterium]
MTLTTQFRDRAERLARDARYGAWDPAVAAIEVALLAAANSRTIIGMDEGETRETAQEETDC